VMDCGTCELLQNIVAPSPAPPPPKFNNNGTVRVLSHKICVFSIAARSPPG